MNRGKCDESLERPERAALDVRPHVCEIAHADLCDDHRGQEHGDELRAELGPDARDRPGKNNAAEGDDGPDAERGRHSTCPLGTLCSPARKDSTEQAEKLGLGAQSAYAQNGHA